MRLTSNEVFRLYGVSESLNESGEYQLESLDAFNEDSNADDLDETLNELADATYGQRSHWYEITDDSYDTEGKICISINDDDCLEIQDITDKIAIDSEHSRFFILVSAELTDYQWVVAEPKGAVYSG